MASEPQAPVPTSSVLLAISHHLAIACAEPNKAFLQCKKKDANPAACLKQGDEVTLCTINLLKDLDSKCPEQIHAFAACLDYYSGDFTKCRDKQKAFLECAPVNPKKS